MIVQFKFFHTKHSTDSIGHGSRSPECDVVTLVVLRLHVEHFFNETTLFTPKNITPHEHNKYMYHSLLINWLLSLKLCQLCCHLESLCITIPVRSLQRNELGVKIWKFQLCRA